MARIILNVVGATLLIVFLAAILFPIFAQVKTGGDRNLGSCSRNMKTLAESALLYVSDHDGYPLAENWIEGTMPYTEHESVYTCPTVQRRQHQSYGYAYNSKLSAVPKSRVESNVKGTYMFYDSVDLARDTSDPATSLPANGRHAGRNVVAFADGHVEKVRFDNATVSQTSGQRK